MRSAGAVLATLAAATLVATAVVPAAAQPPNALPAEVAPGTTAMFRMDEAPGSGVLTDSAPGRHDAAVDPTAVQTGVVHDGATGYLWPRRAPEAYPPSPERVIQVADSPDLEPVDGQFTIEMRYRTKENFGNITQKGQANSPGGQWKIQSPQGIPNCLFAGSAGQVSTGAKTPLNDDQWHNLTCVLTSTGVTMYVDGELRNRKNGTTGRIDNDVPMTIGGKILCDQVKVTCDYFSGQIDFIRLSKASNLAPTARFEQSCSTLTCTFDPSTASDTDGSLARYLWEFGDGTTSTDAFPQHTYAAPGSYNVRLTVTDNQAATSRVLKSVVLDGQGPVSPVVPTGSAVTAGSSRTPTVVVPATAQVGDRMVLLLSHNTITRTVGTPAGVGTWTSLGNVTAESMASYAWSTTVREGDPGRTITVPLSGTAKHTLTVATYSGVAAGALPASYVVDLAEVATKKTPLVTVPALGWAVSYWADRSGTTTSWTADTRVTPRSGACAADGGRICSLLADSGQGLPAGSYGEIPAVTNQISDEAVMWTIALPPKGDGPVDDPPVPSFSTSCTDVTCTVDASASSDAEGPIASYAWSFGDSTTAAGVTAQHEYPGTGTYPITLTVTDGAGQTASTTRTVSVTSRPVASSIALVGTDARASGVRTPGVPVPAGTQAGDRLVLVLSLNNTARAVGTPTGVAGWTRVDSVVAGTMVTTMWTKEAAAGDAGRTVSVPLDGAAKTTLSIGSYSGVAADGLTVTRSVDLSSRTTRTTPSTTAPAGAWVAWYWADKSATTTAWTAAAPATGRSAVCGTDSGRICSLLADSAGPVAAGAVAGAAASTNVASKEATAWTVVLAPASTTP